MTIQLFIEKHKFKLLILTLFLALVVRLSVFPIVFSNGNVTFLGADTYYHVRRILFTVSHFPDTLLFDSYIDFPYGAKIGWAPLYDLFTALVALIVGFGNPSFYTIEATAAVVPVLFGVLTVLLVFFIAEKLFDWRIGLISAGIFAITPAHVYVSFLGYAGHHVAETLFSTIDYLFFIIALKYLQKNNISFNNFRTNIFKNSLFPSLTGIALSLSLFMWEGASIFIGLIGLYIPVQFVIDKKFGRSSDYLLITGGMAFLVSLLIVTPLAISRGGGFEIYLPSLFHVVFLAAFFFLCVLLGLMQKWQFKKWWYHPLLLMLLFASGGYFLEVFFPQFFQTATIWIGYLFGGGILSTIQEAVPLFINPATGFTLDNVWYAFTLSFFIAMLSFAYFIIKTIKEKYAFESVFLVIWTLIVLTLTILQRRFIYLLAVNIAIFSAYFIIEVLKLLTPQTKTVITKKKRKARRTSSSKESRAGLIIGLFLILFLAIPNIIVIKSMATENAPVPDPDLQESFKWLKDNSPHTSYYENPDKPAEYGVMSWWDYGNWILYFSERPVVANNFQTGIDDASHFLTEPDEKIANEILNKRRVRFVITDAQMVKLKFRSIAMLAGRNPNDYYGINEPSEAAQIRSVNNENRNFFSTMLSRLYVFDGNGLSHYRLIYESKTTAIKSPDIKYVKIFEYVPGATISGKTSTNGDIKVTLNILTNQGRTFAYTQQTVAKNGRYEIIVPYSTQGSKYETKPVSDYVIQYANASKAVPVSENDVMEGRELQIDLV